MEAGSTPVLVHNCNEVEYGSTRLSRAVQRARLAAKNKDNNYAAALLRHPETGEDMGVVVARSQGKIHAEQNIINSLKNVMPPRLAEAKQAAARDLRDGLEGVDPMCVVPADSFWRSIIHDVSIGDYHEGSL
ncbi:hypothetical protein ACL02U_30460 [Streptomyces sp. MS06]|uniref:hypothetical protein n=1 Tax=Streptomyces sp. MS06 TaxID=3385974 RepID=UPI0039A02C41